ncbi:MAG: response regulator [Gemmatimonadetes bacterium]|nr:response regulator [Gemmatimonadota bacterium]
MRSAIARRADRVELLELAKRGGMIPMWEAGLRRVVEGLTSLPELLDNVPAPMAEQQAEQLDVDAVVARLLGRTPPGASSGAPAAAPAPGAATAVAAPPMAMTPVVSAPAGPSHPVVLRPPRQLPADAPRVLVALDSRDERRAVRSALEDAGCSVIEAADGEAALAYTRRLAPALVITELVLPKLDGYALAQALGDDGGPPCIAFTVQSDEQALVWARECGCCAVVPAHDGPAALATAAREALAAAGRQIRLAI